jgi:SpoVK/Ycf46/Vps4 family AAA+-type ATPase
LIFQLPLMYKHLFSSKLRKRSGVLLYGPPGTGKVGLKRFHPDSIVFLFSYQ